MPVKVNAGEYLKHLKNTEMAKPPRKRKPVPSNQVMAAAGGVSRQAVTGFLNRDNHRRVDLNVIGGIIAACRNYGHNTKLTDVLEYVEE